MAWKSVQYQLKSACPMIMHNGQTADPLNKHAKALKQLSSKRQKTDEIFEQMARVEFIAGLYVNADMRVVIPASNIESMLIAAAKKVKDGPIAKSGVFCESNAVLSYEGPQSPDALWEDERFRFSCAVKVGMARVMRMRPRFDEWAAVVAISYEDAHVNVSQVDTWITISGQTVGLGDWRPRFGRFTAKRV